MIAYGMGLADSVELAFNLASQSALDGGGGELPPGNYVTTDSGSYLTTDDGSYIILG